MFFKERPQLVFNLSESSFKSFSFLAVAFLRRCHPAVSEAFIAEVNYLFFLCNPYYRSEVRLTPKTSGQLIDPPAKRWFFHLSGLASCFHLVCQVKISNQAIEMVEQQDEPQKGVLGLYDLVARDGHGEWPIVVTRFLFQELTSVDG